MTKDRPDWEEAEQRRGEWKLDVVLEWLRQLSFEEEITCTTCRDFASSSPEVMTLHALGCEQVELVPLAVVVEAELLLMAAYAERHGCGCPKHRPWAVS